MQEIWKKEHQNDAFMGAGFEELLKKAKEKGCDLIIGKFSKNSDWKLG